MTDTAPADPTPLDPVALRALTRLRGSGPEFAAALVDVTAAASVARIARCSDFAIDTMVRQPGLLARLLADHGAAPIAPPSLHPENRNDWPTLLRRWRAAESTRLVWRDVPGWTASRTRSPAARASPNRPGSSRWPRSKRGSRTPRNRARHGDNGVLAAASLVVFGLGKLGGGELNFSSDIDLIYAFAEHGTCDGARPLDAEDYFTRVGQRLAQAARRCHRRRLLPSRRPAPAPLRRFRPPGAELRGDGAVLPARRSRLGTLRVDQGAARGRRHRRRRALPRQRCGPSSIAATSTTPRSTACAR